LTFFLSTLKKSSGQRESVLGSLNSRGRHVEPESLGSDLSAARVSVRWRQLTHSEGGEWSVGGVSKNGLAGPRHTCNALLAPRRGCRVITVGAYLLPEQSPREGLASSSSELPREALASSPSAPPWGVFGTSSAIHRPVVRQKTLINHPHANACIGRRRVSLTEQALSYAGCSIRFETHMFRVQWVLVAHA
jgi:hypothetical protein